MRETRHHKGRHDNIMICLAPEYVVLQSYFYKCDLVMSTQNKKPWESYLLFYFSRINN